MALATKHIIGAVQTWPEAEIIERPSKGRGEPRVLVRRRFSDLEGPNGEELIYLPGNPCISLFTGAGGFDIGVERAGFCCLCQHEWDGVACETLISNRPNFFRHAALIQGDIRLTPTSMLLKQAGLEVGEPHAIIGGPPCQGFSTSNTQRNSGKHDIRNDLVYEYLRVINEAKPKFFIMENVPGFTNFNGGEYLKKFLQTAFGHYYELVYGLCNAVEHGVPQQRIRFICMGTRRDLFEMHGKLASMPRPQNFEKSDLKIIASLDELEADRFCRPPGIRYFPDRQVLIPPAPCHGDGRTQAFHEFYRNLEETEPDRLIFAPR